MRSGRLPTPTYLEFCRPEGDPRRQRGEPAEWADPVPEIVEEADPQFLHRRRQTLVDVPGTASAFTAGTETHVPPPYPLAHGQLGAVVVQG